MSEWNDHTHSILKCVGKLTPSVNNNKQTNKHTKKCRKMNHANHCARIYKRKHLLSATVITMYRMACVCAFSCVWQAFYGMALKHSIQKRLKLKTVIHEPYSHTAMNQIVRNMFSFLTAIVVRECVCVFIYSQTQANLHFFRCYVKIASMTTSKKCALHLRVAA